MKPRLLTIITLITLSTTIFAQDTESATTKKNTFKANPLGLILGIGKINYERQLGPKSSAQLGFSFFSYTADGSGLSGFSLLPEYRFFVNGTAVEGFYIAPFAKYNSITYENEGDLTGEDFKAKLNVYRIGAKGGFQWLLGKNENFVIDLAFGGKYSDFNLKVKEGNDDDFDNENLFEGFTPELSFAIGFVF